MVASMVIAFNVGNGSNVLVIAMMANMAFCCEVPVCQGAGAPQGEACKGGKLSKPTRSDTLTERVARTTGPVELSLNS